MCYSVKSFILFYLFWEQKTHNQGQRFTNVDFFWELWLSIYNSTLHVSYKYNKPRWAHHLQPKYVLNSEQNKGLNKEYTVHTKQNNGLNF